MAQPRIEELFDHSRFPSGGLHSLLLAFYFPVGMLLAVIRFFIGFEVFLIACILPKTSVIRSHVLRVMCSILGVVIQKKDSEKRDQHCKVIVTNFISTFDRLAVDLVYPSVMPSVWDLPTLLNWMLGYSDFGVKDGREVLINNAKKHCERSSLPLLAHPEGASTNGACGLLKFSVWPFSLKQAVQPVLIQIHKPMVAKLAPSVLGGRWWMDVFWSLFVPYTVYSLRVLPVVSQREEESIEEFTKRVQQLMATEMGVAATNHTSADKVEYAKRKLIPQDPQNNQTRRKELATPSTPSRTLGSAADPTTPDTRLNTMAKQVREVLPHVPLEVIKRDLGSTRDVDLTITNILEGRISFTPETSSGGTANKATSSASPSTSTPKPIHAQSFSKSPKDRALSLDERKQALRENARRRYLAKHSSS